MRNQNRKLGVIFKSVGKKSYVAVKMIQYSSRRSVFGRKLVEIGSLLRGQELKIKYS